MPLVEIELHPEKRQLRVFGLALSVILGILAWRVNAAIGIAAVLAAALAAVVPAALRWVYVGMMIVAYPVGLVVSWVVLAAVYYGVVTPLGWLGLLCGRDLLSLRRRRDEPTYWVKRKPPPANESYFHQW